RAVGELGAGGLKRALARFQGSATAEKSPAGQPAAGALATAGFGGQLGGRPRARWGAIPRDSWRRNPWGVRPWRHRCPRGGGVLWRPAGRDRCGRGLGSGQAGPQLITGQLLILEQALRQVDEG